MSTAILHPIRTLRENIAHIGMAVSASRELSRAGSVRVSAELCNPVTAAIPL